MSEAFVEHLLSVLVLLFGNLKASGEKNSF